MSIEVYAKLVRDKIPYIIKQNGDFASYRKLTLDEYKAALKQKLIEEAIEVSEASTLFDIMRELADVLEVFYALMKVYRMKPAEVEKMRRDRAYNRGAFVSRFFLKYTESKERRP